MVILFSLWFILQWQFPTWLWVISGFFYVISLRPKKKIKKQISFRTQVLPLSLLLAIILIPAVEIYLFIKIGSSIGAFNAVSSDKATTSLVFLGSIIPSSHK